MPSPIASSSAMSRQPCRSSGRLACWRAATTGASRWKDRRAVHNSLRRAVRCASGCARQSCSTWRGKVSEMVVLFDLDGTLVDSVYQHVLAWREALEEAGIALSVWRIHRRIGMSGGLFVNALLRETGRRVDAVETARLQKRHAEAYVRQIAQVRPLPGARELLAYLSRVNVPWAIATS